MARKQRKQRGAELKARVAVEAVRERRTVGELVTQFGVHPAQVYEWKRRLLSGAVELFQDGRSQKAAAQQQGRETELYEQIGRLKMELEWLKKTAQRS
jgi:transposase-like protein